MHANDSTLSSSNADILAIRDRYKKHHRDVLRAHDQLLSPDPLVEEYPETDDYFMEQDRLNQKRINEQIRTYSMAVYARGPRMVLTNLRSGTSVRASFLRGEAAA